MTRGKVVWPVLAGLLLFSAVADADCGLHHEAETVTIDNGWIREAPPAAKVLAGFMTLQNGADAAVAVTGAESPAFERVEIHRTMMRKGMASMAHQESVEVPPHGRMEFSPGGYHLMLINPSRPLRAGDSVIISLHFKSGKSVSAPFSVRSVTGGQHGHH